MNQITEFQSTMGAKDKFQDVRAGWTIRINQRIKDGEKTRLQAFEGTVIARKHGTEAGGTITVRKVTDGIGVEKVFPIFLPSIESVKVLKKTTARRAKLYYLREKSAKEIRRKVKAERSKATPAPEEKASQ